MEAEATDFDTSTGVHYGDMVNNDMVRAVRAIKSEAATLRQMVDGLSVLEKAVAAKQIAAVRRLVEAVERL